MSVPPRKQTSVSCAADCDVIVCYGAATVYDKHHASDEAIYDFVKPGGQWHSLFPWPHFANGCVNEAVLHPLRCDLAMESRNLSLEPDCGDVKKFPA
jgi:hypothetical protein